MRRPTASLSLPFPVPLHACFIKNIGGSGIPSKRYKTYASEAAATIMAQGSPKVSGPVSVRFYLCAPTKAKRDGDNLLKCLFDTLTSNGVIEDDNNRIVRRFSLEWVEASSPCRVEIQAEASA